MEHLIVYKECVMYNGKPRNEGAAHGEWIISRWHKIGKQTAKKHTGMQTRKKRKKDGEWIMIKARN